MFTQAVRLLDYDTDPDRPGRPVLILVGGGALAFLALFLIGVVGLRTWLTHEIDPNLAFWAIGLLFCFYLLGVYVFSYAYELYDVAKALRLTLIVAVFSVAAIVVIVSMLIVLKGQGVAKAGRTAAERTPSLLPVAASYVLPDDEVVIDAVDDIEDAPFATDKPFTIGCQGCGERFTPAPPSASCPFCGRSALAASL